MADKPMPVRQPPTDAALSDDIERIVGYLNDKRSTASERANDLLQDISHRREEMARQSTSSAPSAVPKSPSDAGTTGTDRARSDRLRNPSLAERYHSFCRDLDEMLDSFRARVNDNKQIRH